MTNSTQINADILQERFARKAVSYMSHSTADLPHDITERLRAARFQAVSNRKVVKNQTAAAVVSQGSAAALTWGWQDTSGWWARFGVVLPMIALVVGLFTINMVQSDNRAQEVAEVDVALLTDTLPPEAFSDPGFIQFLKANL
jgi:hypothetical protein